MIETHKRAAAPKKGARKVATPRRAAPVQAYQPKSGEAELVMLAVAVDAPIEAMMALIGGGNLTKEQFKAAFSTELAHGKDLAKIKVASHLYLMASSRMKGLAPTSAIFLMKMLTGSDVSAGGSSATITVKSGKGGGGEPGAPSAEQIVEVSFQIGDESKIKDEG